MAFARLDRACDFAHWHFSETRAHARIGVNRTFAVPSAGQEMTKAGLSPASLDAKMAFSDRLLAASRAHRRNELDNPNPGRNQQPDLAAIRKTQKPKEILQIRCGQIKHAHQVTAHRASGTTEAISSFRSIAHIHFRGRVGGLSLIDLYPRLSPFLSRIVGSWPPCRCRSGCPHSRHSNSGVLHAPYSSQ